MVIRIVLAVLATALLAGCTGAADAGSQASVADEQRAFLDFVACMRERGFDMPDPQFEAGGGDVAVRMRAPSGENGPDLDDPEFQEAEDACRAAHLEGVVGRPDDVNPEERREVEEQMLAYAQCMRENGIDMPDPTFDGGGVNMRVRPGDGTDRDGEAFRAAEEACRQHLPGEMSREQSVDGEQ